MPLWSGLVVVTVRAAPTVRDKVLVAVCGVGDVESVTWAVKVNVPAAVGVPERTPLGVSVTPLGREPEVMAHV
jgi:hypothetical protein